MSLLLRHQAVAKSAKLGRCLNEVVGQLKLCPKWDRNFVRSAFKRIHRTKDYVFAGDEVALNAARVKINDEYKKNKGVTGDEQIQELLKFSDECEHVLKKSVMQVRETAPGHFALRIGKDTHMFDNVPFKEDVVLGPPSSANACCGSDAEKQS